jgi:uncharacterized caspase-like protein
VHPKGPTQPDVDKLANELASAEKGVVVFTSSTGRQFSQEKPEWKNGAFTKALVEAIKGGADFEHDKTISIAGLELYAGDFIKGGGDLIKALADAGIAIWREFRSSGEARRKEIMQELESLRWPQFTVPSGK